MSSQGAIPTATKKENRFDGGLYARTAIAHRPMARNVLDDDNRVVDQDTDREDQGKQADPVDGVAHHERGKQSQQDCGGDDNQSDQGFSPSNGERNQNDDGDGRKSEMEQEFIGLVIGSLAIIARHGDMDAFGDQFPFQKLQPFQDLVGDDHGIRTRALCERQGHGRQGLEAIAALAPLKRPGAGFGFDACDANPRKVRQIDLPAIGSLDLKPFEISDSLDPVPGLNDDGIS